MNCPVCQSVNYIAEPLTLYSDSDTYGYCKDCESRFWLLQDKINSLELCTNADDIVLSVNQKEDELYHYIMYVSTEPEFTFGNPTKELDVEYAKNLFERFKRLQIFL